MSIEIDWELTEAPADDAGDPAQRPPAFPPASSDPPPIPPAPPGRRRNAWWLAVPLVLALVAALGLNYVTRLGWQRISDEVIALIDHSPVLR